MSRCIAPAPDRPTWREVKRDAGALLGFLALRTDGDPLAALLARATRAALTVGGVAPAERVAPFTTWTDARDAWRRVAAALGGAEENDARAARASTDGDAALAARLSAVTLADIARHAARAWHRAVERDRLRGCHHANDNDHPAPAPEE